MDKLATNLPLVDLRNQSVGRELENEVSAQSISPDLPSITKPRFAGPFYFRNGSKAIVLRFFSSQGQMIFGISQGLI